MSKEKRHFSIRLAVERRRKSVSSSHLVLQICEKLDQIIQATTLHMTFYLIWKFSMLVHVFLGHGSCHPFQFYRHFLGVYTICSMNRKVSMINHNVPFI